MKIESLQFYDGLDNYITRPLPYPLFEHEFVSLLDIANCVLSYFSFYNAKIALIWVDNQRFIFLTELTCDIHYHIHINPKK